MMSRFIVFVLVLCCVTPVSSQDISDDDFEARAKGGIEFIYNLEFERAEREFIELARLRPLHPAGHFFLAMVKWWRIMVDRKNEQYDEEFLNSLDRVVDLCDELLDENENDVTALFFKGGSIGFQGRLRFYRDDWLGAANAGRKALPLVQVASAADTNNYDIFLGTGIYKYYAEVFPERYPFIKPLLLFIPPGDKEKGIQQLQTAAEKGKYASIEAKYLLMTLYYRYEKEYQKALSIAIELHDRFSNNMLFHKYLGRCYVSLNNWPMVRQVFSDVAERVQRGQPGYNASVEREAVYYLGICDMNSRDYESALAHFMRCDELSRELDRDGVSGFMVMANLKAGMLYDLLAKRDLAVILYEKVLAMKEYNKSYDQAEQFINTPFAQ
ncbi:MAG: tetratricopeptide repeat protein [Ignavibacteria bacterium]|nr:tetratricopeptide repeat protein [Ignavibacteria bacterium]